MKFMHKAFSFNREFDFVRLNGLRRATGRPPHEWDIYIIKELLDNALDADEILWQQDRSLFPNISINVEYRSEGEPKRQLLIVEVCNRAMFPVEQLEDVFNTKWYTSRKAFIKGLTRGALGNALKTLLGIPYALHNRAAGDWQPLYTPMSIRCAVREYLPRYTVDALAQQVSFTCETRGRRAVQGTMMSVGVDDFQQEQPRTIEDITALAQQYRLCNPHAAISWSVRLDGKRWTREYTPDPRWANKFSGVAPIHWYSLTAFRDVLSALHRQIHGGREDGQIALQSIYRCFLSPEKLAQSNFSADTGSLASADIEGDRGRSLYFTLLRSCPRFDPVQLGAIGPEHAQTEFERTFDIDGEILYQCRASSNPDVPFVFEAVIARMKTGKRQLLTAVNFSPTYGDPFQNRYLKAPKNPEESVLGLRGLLDAYGLLENTAVVLFLHLICPNIEHHEFSKTEIDHIPFKEDMGIFMDALLTKLQQQQEAEALQLEEVIIQTVNAVLSTVNPNERFILPQLLEQIRLRLQQHPQYALWLERANAPSRLQSYVVAYLSRNATLAQSIAQPAATTLTIPLHPDHHFLLPTEHVTQEILAKHHVNKLLYLQERDLEPVAIENNWLCQMDMALLHNPLNSPRLQDALVQCILKCNVPILIWHNAGSQLTEQVRAWLDERHLDSGRLIDLGLQRLTGQPPSLLTMMPAEQAAWLRRRFQELAIPVKAVPSDQHIRQDIGKHFEQLFLERFMEQFKVEIADIFGHFDHQLRVIQAMMSKKLDVKVKKRLQEEVCTASYETALEQVVSEFIEEMFANQGLTLHQFMSSIHIVYNAGSD